MYLNERKQISSEELLVNLCSWVTLAMASLVPQRPSSAHANRQTPGIDVNEQISHQWTNSTNFTNHLLEKSFNLSPLSLSKLEELDPFETPHRE